MLYAIKGLGLRTEINRQLVRMFFPSVIFALLINVVSRQQDQLVAAGSIRLFKLGSTFNENSTAIIFLEDYEKAIKEKYPNRSSLIGVYAVQITTYSSQNKLRRQVSGSGERRNSSRL